MGGLLDLSSFVGLSVRLRMSLTKALRSARSRHFQRSTLDRRLKIALALLRRKRHTVLQYKVNGPWILSRGTDAQFDLGISVASYNLGCFIGACTTIKLGDILGRRKTIFLGSSIMVVGAALQCSAYSLAHFIVGRIITG